MSVHVQWSRVRAAVAVAVVLMLVVVYAPLPLPPPLTYPSTPHHVIAIGNVTPRFPLVSAVAHHARRFLSQLFGEPFILFSILPSCNIPLPSPLRSDRQAATDAVRPAVVAGKIPQQQ